MATNKYFKSFIIGSSYLSYITFLIGAVLSKKKNYDTLQYAFIVPLYFGLMNALSLYLFPDNNRYIIIGILSPLLVIIFNRIYNAYELTEYQWVKYYVFLIIMHFVTYNFIIANLEKCILLT